MNHMGVYGCVNAMQRGLGKKGVGNLSVASSRKARLTVCLSVFVSRSCCVGYCSMTSCFPRADFGLGWKIDAVGESTCGGKASRVMATA